MIRIEHKTSCNTKNTFATAPALHDSYKSHLRYFNFNAYEILYLIYKFVHCTVIHKFICLHTSD